MGKVKTIFIHKTHQAEILDTKVRRDGVFLRFGKGDNAVVKGINGTPIVILNGELKKGDIAHLTGEHHDETFGWVKLLAEDGGPISQDATRVRTLNREGIKVAKGIGEMASTPGVKQVLLYVAAGACLGFGITIFLGIMVPTFGALLGLG